MTLNDFIKVSKEHGRTSAKFFTSYKGEDIYIGLSTPSGRFRGYPLLMKEKNNKIVVLTRNETDAVLISLPDDE